MSNRGMFLKKAKPTNIQEAVWWEEYCIRRQGGYDFDGTNLPINNGWIPKGAILKKTSTGGCAVVKTAKVAEKATQSAKAVMLYWDCIMTLSTIHLMSIRPPLRPCVYWNVRRRHCPSLLQRR